MAGQSVFVMLATVASLTSTPTEMVSAPPASYQTLTLRAPETMAAIMAPRLMRDQASTALTPVDVTGPSDRATVDRSAPGAQPLPPAL